MYLNKSTALQILHRNETETIKLKNFSTADESFNPFEKGFNNLKGAGASIKEAVKSSADSKNRILVNICNIHNLYLYIYLFFFQFSRNKFFFRMSDFRQSDGVLAPKPQDIYTIIHKASLWSVMECIPKRVCYV